MSPETVEVTIGRIKMHVPMVIDEATTLRVAERVNDRLESYPMQGGKIDDLSFALRAAFEFAADFERVSRKRAEEGLRLKQEVEDDTAEIAAALDEILESLRGILESRSPLPE